MSRRARVGVEAAVSLVVLVALLRYAGVRQVVDALRGTRAAWFLPALAVNVATIPLMAWRWRLLLHSKGIRIGIGWLTRTYFVALFFGQFLPAAVGGDAVRAIELGRRTGDSPEAVASVLIDRLVGVVGLVALAAIGAAAGAGGAHRPLVAIAEGLFGVAALAVLGLLFSSRVRGLTARVLEPRGGAGPLAAGAHYFEALHGYRHHRATLAAVCGLALVVQLARVGAIWMLSRALGLEVPAAVILVTGPVLFAALILPVSLNGIGVREAVFVEFLQGHASASQAFALGVGFFAVGTLTALLGAAILIERFARHGLRAVRPRTRIDTDQPGD
ncbi:MAG TPA: lysylphosphatidylglycerol synthase transmembrane domain-containing protein [Gaiellales bacterium]|nr:lysylphosphatidylglycerol synthase transmembrane domain-containing protein [Gaiellales bacterium]